MPLREKEILTMIYLSFLLVALCNSTASVSTKFNTRIGGKVALFNFVRALVPLAAFVLVALITGEELTPLTVLFGAVYGVAMTAATRTGYTALALGPMGITSAIAQCSLVPVTVWCVLVDGEPFTVLKAVGICLAVAALVVMNAEKPDRDYPHKKKWLIFSFLTLFFNAVCSITITLAGKYGVSGGAWFTAFSYVVATIAFGGVFVFGIVGEKRKRALLIGENLAEITASADDNADKFADSENGASAEKIDGAGEKNEASETEKRENEAVSENSDNADEAVEKKPAANKTLKTAVFGGLAGFTTAASAFTTFLLSSKSQGSILFPAVAVVTLLTSFVAGTVIFREKPTIKRVIAIILASAAIFILKFAA